MSTWNLGRFSELVAHMRVAQRRYFAGRRRASRDQAEDLLRTALDLERRVDAAVDEIAARRPLFDREDDGPGESAAARRSCPRLESGGTPP